MNSFEVGIRTELRFFEACSPRPNSLKPFCGLLILIKLSATSAFSQTVFLDFNADRQYTSNFNPWNDATGINAGNYCFAEGTNAGVNVSGGVSVFQNTDTTATFN